MTPSAGANGTISPATPQAVNHNGTTSFTVTPDAGYSASVAGTCPAGSWSGNDYTTGQIVGHCTVAASFTQNTYAITTSVSAGSGTVSCTPNPVPHGDGAACTATPAAGYTFASWGGACSGSGACTVSNVTSARSVTASFMVAPPPPPPSTYNVTAAASPAAGGTASCTPSSVASGGSSTCTATASAGYRFAGWGGDCTGTEASCTLSNIVADRSATAAFVPILTVPEGPDNGEPLQLEAIRGAGGWTLAAAGTATVASTGVPPPAGVSLPHGVVSLRLIGGTPGSSATVVLTYPQPLPPGTVYYKFGPTQANRTPHWHRFDAAAISGNTIALTLVDGGAGDGDLAANGVIVDPGGPALLAPAGAVAPIPTLSEWATLLLAGLVGLLAFGRPRRLPQA